jgi:hypothetical protein
MLRVKGLHFWHCILALGYINLTQKNASEEDFKFNKWDQRRCTKKRLEEKVQHFQCKVALSGPLLHPRLLNECIKCILDTNTQQFQ